MENLQSRKKLFEFISRVMEKNVTNDEVQAFCEMLIYEPPYKSRIVFPSKPEDLSVSFEKLEEREEIFGSLAPGGDYSKRKIRVNASQYSFREDKTWQGFTPEYHILNLLGCIGHEYTHYLQERAMQIFNDGQIKINPKLQKILDSYEQIKIEDNLQKLMELEGKIRLNPKQMKLYNLNEIAYEQLLHEEHARTCEYEYIKEMLSAMLKDPLCTKEQRKFLKKCKRQLSRDWGWELADRYSSIYEKVRKALSASLEKLGEYNIEKIKTIDDPILKQQVIDNKLFSLRKANIDKAEYFRILCKLGRDFDAASVKFLLEGDNPACQKEILKQFMICYAAERESVHLLHDTNFLCEEEKPNYFSAEEIVEVCRAWARQGKFEHIFNFLSITNRVRLANQKKGNDNEIALTWGARQKEAYKAVTQDSEIKDLINRQFYKCKEIEEQRIAAEEAGRLAVSTFPEALMRINALKAIIDQENQQESE